MANSKKPASSAQPKPAATKKPRSPRTAKLNARHAPAAPPAEPRAPVPEPLATSEDFEARWWPAEQAAD